MTGRVHLNEKNLCQLIDTGILIGIFLLGIGSFLGIEQMRNVYLAVAFGEILLLAGIQFLQVRGQIMCLLSAGIFVSVVILVVGIGESVSFVQSYFRWVFNSGTWNEGWITGYELLQVILVTLLCYFFQTFLEKYIYLRVGAACLFLGGALVSLFSKVGLSHVGMISILFYILLTYVEWQQSHWDKNRKRSVKAYLFWIMPFAAVYYLILLLIPAPEKPYEWKWAKNIYQQAKEAFVVAAQNILDKEREDFEMSMSGFSGDASIGGDISLNSREIMTIHSKYDLVTNVYLAGTVYHTFNGREWEQSRNETASDYLLDTLETVYAAQKYSGSYLTDYLQTAYLDINYQYFITDNLFVPLKYKNISETDKRFSVLWEKDNPFFTKSKGYGTEYQMEYYQMNADWDEFYEFIKASKAPDEQEWKEILKRYKYDIGENISLENVGDYLNEINNLYLKEVILSDQVRDYLNEITKSADTDVDKLRAIEQELSSFTYTLTPGELPDSVTDESSFLDYFLLESREGYCTYFATAFVLLARAEGIPARYVQGFCVPMKGKSEMMVYSNMAHAWPEVYFEGVGWIYFEPTPGYDQIRYTPWKMQQIISDNQSKTVGSGPLEDYGSALIQDPEEALLLEEEIEEEAGFIGENLWKITGLAALFTLAGGVLLLLLDRVLGSYRYGKMSADGKFRIEVARNMTILSWLKYTRSDKETLQEFKLRLENTLDFPNGELQFISDYEELLYGEKEIHAEQIDRVKKDRTMLLNLCKNKRKPAYIYSRLKWY